jgi:hypothetical protein
MSMDGVNGGIRRHAEGLGGTDAGNSADDHREEESMRKQLSQDGHVRYHNTPQEY